MKHIIFYLCSLTFYWLTAIAIHWIVSIMIYYWPWFSSYFLSHLSTVLLDLPQWFIRQFPLFKKSITLMYNGQHVPSSTFCISRHFGQWIAAIMNAWAENSLLWTIGIQPLFLLLQKERCVPWDSQLPPLVSEQGTQWAATLLCFNFHKSESKVTFKNVGNESHLSPLRKLLQTLGELHTVFKEGQTASWNKP